MSDNDELKEVAKKLIRIGMEVGKPVAKKVLESETGKTIMTVGMDLAVDIMSGVTEKMAEPKTVTPPKPWNKMSSKEAEELGELLREKDPTLAEKSSKVAGGRKNETK